MNSKELSIDLSKELSIDDLICLYNCVDLEIQRFQLSSCPDTLKKYFNQLNKLLANIHKAVLTKERLLNPINKE